METMRALVYDRPSVCSVRDVPMPVCGEDEVVIEFGLINDDERARSQTKGLELAGKSLRLRKISLDRFNDDKASIGNEL
mgnify:CR=1 FL=1